MTMAEPLLHTKLGDNDTVYFFMPRSFVDQRFAGAANVCSRAVEAQHGIQRLAHDSLIALQHEASSMSQEEFQAATRMACELVLLALGGAGELMSDASSIRAANLARVKRVMRARSAAQDLALADVARECGLSLRYLHDLFRDDGRTASEFLRGERLQRARRMLESAPTRLVTDVSMSCGFSSPSQFATAFRRAYGISPRDVKRRA
jgi:AraC-like DNA-binding protein